MPTPAAPDGSGVRLHVVTGKGGTGKTTVAAALALALASGGRRTLLVEVEERQGIARLFDSPPLPYDELKIAVAPGGGDVYGLSVEAEDALLEYLELFYHLRRAGRVMERIGAVDFATTIAPGLRDVLLTGKVYEAVRRRRSGRHVYDAVVLDAPPTGRIGRFLNVNAQVSGIARVGPIHSQAESIMSLLRSPRTAVHLVTVLEEMPVQETVDGVAELHRIGLPVGAVVVNRVREPVLHATDLVAAAHGRLDPAQVRAGLVAAGVVRGASARGEALVGALLTEASDHAVRMDLEDRGRDVLAALGRPTYELPRLAGGVDLGALYELAQSLLDQGVATGAPA